MTFGDRITALREAKKMLQAELAERVGTSAVVMNRYEKDKVAPSVFVAEKIARALDTTVDYLLSGTLPSDVHIADESLLRYIQLFESMPAEEKTYIKAVIKAFADSEQLKVLTGK